MCGKYFEIKHRIAKHIQIKQKNFLFPDQRYQDSRHLLQNPKDPNPNPNNHAQRSTPPYYANLLMLMVLWDFINSKSRNITEMFKNNIY